MPIKNDPTKPFGDTVFPKFTRGAPHTYDIGLGDLEYALERHVIDDGLDLDPDFQRGHVWTRDQQVKFVEFFLKEGPTGRDIYTNDPGWGKGLRTGPFVLVDGKQRLTALVSWLRDEFTVFGRWKRSDVRLGGMRNTLKWHINNLETRAEVLQWYLEFNDGGVVHTQEELDRVRRLLDLEQLRNAPTLPPPATSSVRPRSR